MESVSDRPAPSDQEGVGRPVALAGSAFRFRLVLNLAMLAMLGLSWPLWVGETAFPRVPFVATIPAPPLWASWVCFGGLIAAMASAMVAMTWRRGTLGAVALLAVLVAGDQNRLQPWVYQYLVTATALALSSEPWGLRLSRWFLILLYLHSGLSKLDVTFTRELGPAFLQAGLRPFGLRPGDWPEVWRDGLAVAMPFGELLVALGLAWRVTRRLALGGAVGLHVGLLAILGPWGLGHSTIVLVWNVALLVEDLILFGPWAEGPREPLRDLGHSMPAVAWLIGLVGVLPFGERWGFWDTWPSFAVYASHNERTDILVHRDDRDFYPTSIRSHLQPLPGNHWFVLDLTGWSRSLRRVPVYPQGRVGNGVAEALARSYRTPHLLRVVHRGRAGRFTGHRERDVSVGLDEIRRSGRPLASQRSSRRREAAGSTLGVRHGSCDENRIFSDGSSEPEVIDVTATR